MIHIIYITATIVLSVLSFHLGRHWKKTFTIPWLNSYSSASNEPVYDFKPEEAPVTQSDVEKVVEALNRENKHKTQQRPQSWLGMNE